jgi:undecaprenyl-diphosphatase
MNYFWIFCAQYLFLVGIVIAGAVFLQLPKKHKKEVVIFAAISLPLTYLVEKLAGFAYYNPRPFVVDSIIPLIQHAPDNGFPSDHMLFVSAITMLFYWVDKRVCLVLAGISLGVGISRVEVGVHHFADIFGAVVIAVLVVSAVHFLLLKYDIISRHHQYFF